MELDFTTPGEVRFKMTDYIKNMVNEFSETLINIKTPAEEHLFKIQETIPKLNYKEAA